jgi:hypothetical protein
MLGEWNIAWAESRTGRKKLAAINHILSSLAGLCRLFIFTPALRRWAILITNSKIRRVSTAKPRQLPRFFSLVRANLVRRAEPAKPDEQFRVYLDPDVDHHRPRRDEPAGWRRTRFFRRRQNPMDEVHMLTIFLYPPDLSQEEEHRGRFQQNRAGYYSTLITFCLLDIAQTQFEATFFIRFGTFPSSVSTRFWLVVASSPGDAVTIGSSRGIYSLHC